jgi:hypothetical protein
LRSGEMKDFLSFLTAFILENLWRFLDWLFAGSDEHVPVFCWLLLVLFVVVAVWSAMWAESLRLPGDDRMFIR